MLELFIQYVLEHTGWSLDEISLYQKVDHVKGETISWIERKPQVVISPNFQVESGDEYDDYMEKWLKSRIEAGWSGEDE